MIEIRWSRALRRSALTFCCWGGADACVEMLTRSTRCDLGAMSASRSTATPTR
jgi:hypothetical protein